MTFEEYVDEWDGLVGRLAAQAEALKPLKAKEMEMRKAIAKAIDDAQPLKEGVNNFKLADGRTVKVTQKMKRTIDAAMIPDVRKAYEELNDRTVSFDDILRVKYELSKRDFDKLEAVAAKTVSPMVEVKPESPEVKLS